MNARICPGCDADLTGEHRNRKWCSNRCRITQYGGTCKDCGDSTTGNRGAALAPDQCRECSQSRHSARNAVIAAMWRANVPTKQIAATCGMKHSAVTEMVRRMREEQGMPLRLRRRQNREDWQVIKELLNEGLTPTEIGDAVGITGRDVRARLQSMRRYGGYQEAE